MANIKLAKPLKVNKTYIRNLASEKGCTTYEFLTRLRKNYVILFYDNVCHHAWYPHNFEGHPIFYNSKKQVAKYIRDGYIIMSAYEWVRMVTGLEV